MPFALHPAKVSARFDFPYLRLFVPSVHIEPASWLEQTFWFYSLFLLPKALPSQLFLRLEPTCSCLSLVQVRSHCSLAAFWQRSKYYAFLRSSVKHCAQGLPFTGGIFQVYLLMPFSPSTRIARRCMRSYTVMSFLATLRTISILQGPLSSFLPGSGFCIKKWHGGW